MLLQLLHNALGSAPMGFEALEYLFAFILLLIGLFIVWQIIDSFFGIFRNRRG